MKATDKIAERIGQKIIAWMDKSDVGPITLMVLGCGAGLVVFNLLRIIFKF